MRKFILALLFAGILTGISPMVVFARIGDSGKEGEDGNGVTGGGCCARSASIDSTAINTGKIVKNTKEAADNTNKLIGTILSSTLYKIEADKARETWAQNEIATRFKELAGKLLRLKAGAAKSYAGAMATSAMMSNGTSVGQNRRALVTSFDGVPAYGRLSQGKGRTISLYHLVSSLCESGCLEQDHAANLSKMSAFSGCSSDPEVAGAALDSAKLRTAQYGTELGPGGKHVACVALRLAMAEEGEGLQIVSQSEQRSIREILKAELNEILDENGKIRPAFYPTNDERSSLFQKVAANPSTTDAIKENAWTLMGYMGKRACIFDEIAGTATFPLAGKDGSKAVAEAAEDATGLKPCKKGGKTTSEACIFNLQAAAAYGMGRNAHGAEASEAEQMSSQFGLLGSQLGNRMGAMETMGGKPCSNGVAENMRTVAAALWTPEFRTFLAALDERFINEVKAEVRHDLYAAKVRVAENYNAFLREEGYRTQFAVNGDRIPDTVNGMLAQAGVDGKSYTLTAGDFRFAGLTALLEPSKLNAIEPTQTMLAIDTITAPPTPVAMQDLKAMPIAGWVTQ